MSTLQDARALWVAENPHPVRVEENGVTRELDRAEYERHADARASARLSDLEANERQTLLETKRQAASDKRGDLINPNASPQAKAAATAAAMDYLLARDGL